MHATECKKGKEGKCVELLINCNAIKIYSTYTGLILWKAKYVLKVVTSIMGYEKLTLIFPAQRVSCCRSGLTFDHCHQKHHLHPNFTNFPSAAPVFISFPGDPFAKTAAPPRRSPAPAAAASNVRCCRRLAFASSEKRTREAVGQLAGYSTDRPQGESQKIAS